MSLRPVGLAADRCVVGPVRLRYQLSRESFAALYLASRGWLLIRNDQLTLGAFVKVVIPGLGLDNSRETKKKGKTKSEFQSRTLASNAGSPGPWEYPLVGARLAYVY